MKAATSRTSVRRITKKIDRLTRLNVLAAPVIRTPP
jgi:hypothetical protein